MLKSAAAALAALFFLTSISLAQDNHYDASINGAPIFTKQSEGNGITQYATVGANLFGTFRLRFKPQHSLLFDYGRGKNSQVYLTGQDFHVLTTITEYSGAYMYSPICKKNLEVFGLAGAAGLRFSPRSTWVFFPPLPDNLPHNVEADVGASTQTKPAFLYGVGVDYKIPSFPMLAIRLQYRGFLYKEPTFNVESTTNGALNFFTGTYGHMAEPSIGLVFRF
jgi:hypothetical protein